MDFSELNEADLESECPYISIIRIQKWDIDFSGRELSLSAQGFGTQNSLRKPPPNWKPPAPPRDLWTEVKREFYLLVCTKDRKYADLRSQLDRKSRPATTTIVSMTSAAVATQLGVTAGMITPLVALALYAILKLSLNSWCNVEKASFEKK